jgi:predicted Zn-dependent peptidase
VADAVRSHVYDNGLTLIAERMEGVRSAALNFLVPAGFVHDPEKALGVSSLLSDMLTRGAGSRDSRQLSLALDGLGLDRGESVGAYNMRLWGSTLSRNLIPALEIYADILRRPHLPAAELDPVKALALQDLQALEDEPRQKVMVELRRRHYPQPLGRDHRGTADRIRGVDAAGVRAHYERCFQPSGILLSVAGNVEWEPLYDRVGSLFADWKGSAAPEFAVGSRPDRRAHLTKETEQTQIGVAYGSVPIGHAEYYVAQGAVSVLSGGMSSRLFTEIREKHGLCYAVSASYQTLKDRASVLCYAGTTNERAQKTLDLLIHELRRLQEGVEPDEVKRMQAGVKSALIMQEESTFARAGAIAMDWFYLGRVRPCEEVQREIDALTPERIVQHLRAHPPRDFTIVTLGPKELTLPGTGT